jgi:dTDP-4-dehydrorhamnose reductase
MRVLITGGSGLLGRQLMTAFADCEATGTAFSRSGTGLCEATGTAFSRSGTGLKHLDLTDPESVDAFIREVAPDVIIHSAAQRRPDVSEGDPEATAKLNVAATAQLAELAAELGAWMLYLSTDYVFDGTRAPYAVDAEANPLNNYGRSKFEGEEVMRAKLPHGAILRVPILYGPIEEIAESAITIILESVRKGDAVLDHWATRYPTETRDVAAVCRALANRQLSHGDVSGTYHFSGDESLTKYDIGMIMAELCDLPTGGLKPNPEAPPGAPRPKDCQLDCSRTEALVACPRRPFRQALAEALAPHI